MRNFGMPQWIGFSACQDHSSELRKSRKALLQPVRRITTACGTEITSERTCSASLALIRLNMRAPLATD
jgi:hypothetical protein